MTRRILVIGEHATTSGWLRLAPVLSYQLETASGSADAVHRLRQRAFEVVVTSPETPINEDLALLEEVSQVRPGGQSDRPGARGDTARRDCRIASQSVCLLHGSVRPAGDRRGGRRGHGGKRLARGDTGVDRPSEWIGLRVTCSMLNADRLVQFMTELRSDIPATDRDDLLLAFREMLLNAMEHGAGFDPEKVVDVAAVRTQRAIVYYFRDPGLGFQLAHLGHAAIANPPSDPAAHLDRRASMGLRPGGFGILLAGKLVDEVIYSEVGNEVLLIKRLAPPGAG